MNIGPAHHIYIHIHVPLYIYIHMLILKCEMIYLPYCFLQVWRKGKREWTHWSESKEEGRLENCDCIFSISKIFPKRKEGVGPVMPCLWRTDLILLGFNQSFWHIINKVQLITMVMTDQIIFFICHCHTSSPPSISLSHVADEPSSIFLLFLGFQK